MFKSVSSPVDLIGMDWNSLDKPITSDTRLLLYKFLINKPDAVKMLIRHLTEAEGCDMIAALANADDRKAGRKTSVQKKMSEAEIDSLLLT